MSGKEILFLTFSFSLFGSQWNFGRVWPHPRGEVFAFSEVKKSLTLRQYDSVLSSLLKRFLF